MVDMAYQVPLHEQKRLGFAPGTRTVVSSVELKELRSKIGEPTAVSSGGSVCNSIALYSQLGGEGRMFFACGDDKVAADYMASLKRSGVPSEPVTKQGAPTGELISLVGEDGTRTFVTNIKDSARLSVDDLKKVKFGEHKWLLLSGYLLQEINAEGDELRELASRAKSEGVKVVLSLSDPDVVKRLYRVIEKVIPEVELLVGNIEELKVLSGDKPVELINATVRSVIVTEGANGATVYTKGEKISERGRTVKALDTTGAGDAFLGGVLYAVDRGFGWPEALKVGNYFGSEAAKILRSRFQDTERFSIESALA